MKRPRDAFMLDDDRDVSMTADAVLEGDGEVPWSGLYDARGNKLYRRPDRLRFGFVPS